MQITLNEEEIKDAIVAYVRQQITITDTQRIEVDLKAGRGDNGYSATLDIRPAQAPSTAGTKATKATAPAFRSTDPEAEPEAQPETSKEQKNAQAQATSKFRGLKPASITNIVSPKEAPEHTPDEEGSDDVVDADAAEAAKSREGTKEEEAVTSYSKDGGENIPSAPESSSEEEPEATPAVIKPTRSIFNVTR